MRKEYDFSKGERGKFFNAKAKFNIPIYLDSNTQSFVENIARKKKSNPSKVVNDLIKTDMQIADCIK